MLNYLLSIYSTSILIPFLLDWITYVLKYPGDRRFPDFYSLHDCAIGDSELSIPSRKMRMKKEQKKKANLERETSNK